MQASAQESVFWKDLRSIMNHHDVYHPTATHSVLGRVVRSLHHQRVPPDICVHGQYGLGQSYLVESLLVCKVHVCERVLDTWYVTVDHMNAYCVVHLHMGNTHHH